MGLTLCSLCPWAVLSAEGLPDGVGTLVDCWYVDEVGGRSSFPSSIVQEPAVLLLRHVPYGEGEEPEIPADLALPSELKPGRFFAVRDPSRITAHPGFGKAGDPREKLHCEINKYGPQDSSVVWATHLTEDEKTPAYQSSSWFCSFLRTFDHSFSVASLHRVTSGPREAGDPSPIETSVVLNVFSRTPSVTTGLGHDVLLDCGFAMDRQTGFAVEWRYQFKGSGHLVYAYNGAHDRVDMAEAGTEMFFYEAHSRGNASLLIRNVEIRHEGSYICTIYMPNLHAQQSIELQITERPKVTVSPDPLVLVPGQEQTVTCDVSSYYPLDVTVSWTRKGVAGNSSSEHITDSLLSGHRQNPDGTYNMSSYLRVVPSWEDHLTTYTCYVDHDSIKTPVRKTVTLKVAGASGPSLDDAIGMFLCAFIVYGILKFLYWIFMEKVYGLLFGTEGGPAEKVKSN
ncbi:tapasin-like [Chiloscyllium punctatum]